MKEQTFQKTELIAVETKRLSDKYGKAFLNTKDIIEIMGLGRDNVRTLMKSPSLPVVKVGRRKIVSIVNFVSWQFNQQNKET